jgi:uncharacterized protein HemX
MPIHDDGESVHEPSERSESVARTSRDVRRRDERGEGVISTAIAVLIVAFLGIALWTGFDGMMNNATERTRAQVEQIGE